MSVITRRLTLVILALACLAYLLPIFWMLNSSFRYHVDLIGGTPISILTRWTLVNYTRMNTVHPFWSYLANSARISSLACVFALIIGAPAAYAFARRPSKLFGSLLLGIFAIRMIPGIVLIIPLYQWLSRLDLLDTVTGMVMVYTALQLPLTIWLMKGGFEEIPSDLDEAAQIDGCSRLGVLWRIILPVGRSSVLGAGIFAFLGCWSEYLFALVLTATPASTTATVGMAGLVTQHEILWEIMAAEGTIFLIPVALGLFFAQRYLITGLTAGAVKG